MKKIYLLLLMLLILFIPTSINAVAIYQLDQPVSELNGNTLRQVFQNRNRAMPDLSTAIDLGGGNYRLYNGNGIVINFNVNGGYIYINGIVTNGFNYNFTNLFDELNPPTILSYFYSHGSITGSFALFTSPYNANNVMVISSSNYMNNNIKVLPSNINRLRFQFEIGQNFNQYQFMLQLEKGSQPSPYQLPTNGPYGGYDLGQFGLSNEQIDKYYNLYLEAVRFEQENVQASQDIGGYQNIFRSIINGVKNLISEMGYVWQWLNAPILTSDFRDYQFNIDWSWDLIGVIRQIVNSAGVLVMQILFFVPSAMFILTGIPIQVSILSLLFSNLIFLLLGWIMVKSFLI